MKFAKELEEELVPEWRLKYLDYKVAKKKVKAVAKAIRDANKTTPRTPRFRNKSIFAPTSLRDAPEYSYLNRGPPSHDPHSHNEDIEGNPHRTPPSSNRPLPSSLRSSDKVAQKNNTFPKKVKLPEEQPLNVAKHRAQGHGDPRLTRYGSIICSPPDREDSPLAARGLRDSTHSGHSNGSKLALQRSFELPDPAMDPTSRFHSNRSGQQSHTAVDSRQPASNSFSKVPTHADGDNAYEAGKTRHPPASKTKLSTRHLSIFQPKRMNSTPGDGSGKPLIRRVMSLGGVSNAGAPDHPTPDVPLEAFREIDIRQSDFFTFLDLELEKIERFYKEKEDEATERLKVLRDQLHIMRDRRMDEVLQMRYERQRAKKNGKPMPDGNGALDDIQKKAEDKGVHDWLLPANQAWETLKNGRVGKASKSLAGLGTPPGPHPIDGQRDYVRRATGSAIPYRAAKRKLKYAVQEYYRGLELLKSYALLNRTAFRKINKKYDKAVNARPTNRYVQEKINKAYFVQSDVLEGHIRAVEDLYSRYFEGGNYKIAASKLRAKHVRPEDYTSSVFRNGVTLSAGLVFGVQGIVNAIEQVFDSDPVLAINAAYLCQIYAGYFLMLVLVLFFCMACKFWTKSKVNYVFVFEFDTRHHLDWRQLFELPCIFFFLLGFFVWLNFSRYGAEVMYIWYPVILVGLTACILLFPAPYLYHHTRTWFLYSNWRLFFAGLYPVEFRDFFLGDMFCSQTYALGNIELFFCLYANDWTNPSQCGSSSSRLLGFFSTLPGIWRALQCLRRYYDTRNIFPHLVNFGKYGFTILYYMSLSLYRVDKIPELRALFIVFASINAIYCSFWDLAMDWSLLDPTAEHPLLRKELGFKQVWIYYAAIIIDPILRFNWIFYALFQHQTQHAAALSFFVAFSEVCRRGIWLVFRVENEHCTNVQRYRASRDLPLPYEIRENTPLLPAGATPVSPKPSPEMKKRRQKKSKAGGEGSSSDEEAATQIDGSHKGSPATDKGQDSPAMAKIASQLMGSNRPSANGRSQTGGAPGESSQQNDGDDNLKAPTRASTNPQGQDKLSRTPTIHRHKADSSSYGKETNTWKRALGRVGSILQLAHAQDFERRRVIPGVDDADDEDHNHNDSRASLLRGQEGDGGEDVEPKKARSLNPVRGDTAEGRRRAERATVTRRGEGVDGGVGLSSDEDELDHEEFERLVDDDDEMDESDAEEADTTNNLHRRDEGRAHDADEPSFAGGADGLDTLDSDDGLENLTSPNEDGAAYDDDVIADAGRSANAEAHDLVAKAERLDREEDRKEEERLEAFDEREEEEEVRGFDWRNSFEEGGSGTVRRSKAKKREGEDTSSDDEVLSPGRSS